MKKLEERLERRRKGPPTAQQLMFLFREKIPIPLTLTWGDASDIIDERLKQIAIDKEARQQAREELRRKKEELKQRAFDPPYHTGEKVLHPSFGVETVLHAGNVLAGGQICTNFEVKRGKSVSIMGIGVDHPGGAAPDEVSTITTLLIGSCSVHPIHAV